MIYDAINIIKELDLKLDFFCLLSNNDQQKQTICTFMPQSSCPYFCQGQKANYSYKRPWEPHSQQRSNQYADNVRSRAIVATHGVLYISLFDQLQS